MINNVKKYHETVLEIIDILDKNNIWYETLEHESVRTSQEADKIRMGHNLGQGAKAIILRLKYRDKSRKFVMLVIPGDLRFDSKKVKTFFDVDDIRFASQEEVFELTDGVLPGGIPPFGNIFKLEVIMDPKLLENKKIVFNAGDRRFSISMKVKDYIRLVSPKLVSIID